MRSESPLACVIGDMDLVRPLGLAGIRSAVVARAGSRTRYSRFTTAVVDWVDPWKHPEELVERLVAFSRSQPERPVLYYEGDWDLLAISRFRDRLRECFRFVVPDGELVERLVDKARFRALADELDLPVPPSREVRAAEVAPSELGLRFPLVVKPLTRQAETWEPIAQGAKAIRASTPAELEDVWSRLAAADVDVLAQELVVGPETAVESYHVYVGTDGDVAGEFTGKKIRTLPPEYGFSTALVTTDDPTVAALGRELVRRLDLRGVAKLDFKRGPDGALRLLEVNPRFNLWHHLGAKAGVNLPALVYADLVARPRPAPARARPGVRWCHPRGDVRAARAVGISTLRWARWAFACEAKSALAWDDPMPLLRGGLARLARRRAEAATASGSAAERSEGQYLQRAVRNRR